MRVTCGSLLSLAVLGLVGARLDTRNRPMADLISGSSNGVATISNSQFVITITRPRDRDRESSGSGGHTRNANNPPPSKGGPGPKNGQQGKGGSFRNNERPRPEQNGPKHIGGNRPGNPNPNHQPNTNHQPPNHQNPSHLGGGGLQGTSPGFGGLQGKGLGDRPGKGNLPGVSGLSGGLGNLPGKGPLGNLPGKGPLQGLGGLPGLGNLPNIGNIPNLGNLPGLSKGSPDGPKGPLGSKAPVGTRRATKCTQQEVGCKFLKDAAFKLQNDDDECRKIATTFDDQGKISFDPIMQDPENVIYGVTTDGQTSAAWCTDIGWALRKIYTSCRKKVNGHDRCFGGDAYAARNTAFLVSVGQKLRKDLQGGIA